MMLDSPLRLFVDQTVIQIRNTLKPVFYHLKSNGPLKKLFIGQTNNNLLIPNNTPLSSQWTVPLMIFKMSYILIYM